MCSTRVCEVTTLCLHAHTDRRKRICSCHPHEHVHVRDHFGMIFLLEFFFSPTFLEHAMADRSDSWDAFLCRGSFETFDGIIPRSMLAVYPEEVVNDKIIPFREFGSTVCPRYHEGKNCNNRTNCPHFHPHFYQRSLGGPRLHLPQVVPGHVRVPELLLKSTWSNLRLSSPIGVQHTTVLSWPLSTGTISKRRRWHDETD